MKKCNKSVVLVTGASSGFGKLTAQMLIDKGYIVYGAARRVEKMQDLIEAGGYAIKMDVSDETSVKSGVEQIIKEQGVIDVLINNAGYAAYGPVETTSMDIIMKEFQVNVFGLVRVTQAVLPYMRKQKSGRIINISSVVGKISSPLFAWYAGSKHTVEAISDALRMEVKGFGIKVSIIEPGVFSTGFDNVALTEIEAVDGGPAYRNMIEAFKKAFAKMYSKAPKPDPVAKAIVHAISSDSPKIRYRVGTDSKGAVFIRKTFGDTLFDKIIMTQMGIK